MYFDLGKYQKDYPSAYAQFRKYMNGRIGEDDMERMTGIHIETELAMKNTHLAAFEGYFMNFFNKYDLKIGLNINIRGRYTPRVFQWKNGCYENRLKQEFDNRHDAILRAIEHCFGILNIELIINYKSEDENKSSYDSQNGSL